MTPVSGTAAGASRPRWFGETAALAQVARYIWLQRQESYPPLVADGRVPEAEAEHAIAVARAIADDWSWAEAPAGPPPRHPEVTRADRIAALEHAHQRWQARTAAAALDDRVDLDTLKAHEHLTELIATLLWRERQPAGIESLNHLNAALRAQARARADERLAA